MATLRRRGRPGGLRFQLLFGLILLLSAALLFVALGTLQLQKRHLQQLHAAQAQTYLQLLQTTPSPQRDALIQELEKLPTVHQVGSVTESRTEVPLPAPGAMTLIRQDETPLLIARGAETSDYFLILSLASSETMLRSSQDALFLYLGLTLLFITLVGYAFFSFVVIRPLRALSIATERASQGDLASPVQLMPRNEFGMLAHQFNQMLTRLDDQRDQLRTQLNELQTAHRELKHTQDSLIHSEKLATIGQLAAGVAHEVGNPLAAVMGYTELLADPRLDEKSTEEVAERSLKQLKRIRTIIRQLLDYSRNEATTSAVHTDIQPLIDDAVHLVRTTDKARHIAINVAVDDDLPAVQVVPGEISQILINLLLNSLKALTAHLMVDDAERRIVIQASLIDDQVSLFVSDNGPGIDPAIASRIFDPFFTTAGPGEGTGLGLAISTRLAARNGGELRLVESDEGASFQLTLPSIEQTNRHEEPANSDH